MKLIYMCWRPSWTTWREKGVMTHPFSRVIPYCKPTIPWPTRVLAQEYMREGKSRTIGDCASRLCFFRWWSLSWSSVIHWNEFFKAHQSNLVLRTIQNCLPLFFEVFVTRITASSPHLQIGLNPYPWNHEYETHYNLVVPNYYSKRRKTNDDETYLRNTN